MPSLIRPMLFALLCLFYIPPILGVGPPQPSTEILEYVNTDIDNLRDTHP